MMRLLYGLLLFACTEVASGNDAGNTVPKAVTAKVAVANAKTPVPNFSGPIPLDKVSRQVPTKGKISCPKVGRETYRGTHVRYNKPIQTNKWFKLRLIAFEKLVKETAIEVYGRAPTRIRHLGSYYCRRIRTWPNYISEHGLANALDVAEFHFPSVPRKLRKKTPRHLRRAFRVKMIKHWHPKRKRDHVHAVFLHTLTKRIIDKQLFRVVLGPAYPGHKNHLHVDLAPWTITDVWKEDEQPILK